MNSNLTTSQKVGSVIFAIGALYMVGLGWLYAWLMVPAANQSGPIAYSGLIGFAWELSVWVGAFVVAIGAALIARVERRAFWLLILLVVLFTAWSIVGTTRQMIPALFGVGGGMITLFFLGSAWQWAKTRPALSGADRTGSDLRMLGLIFFVEAAWRLCGTFGVRNFILRPELAAKFSIPIGNTINSASTLMVLLVLAWGFTFFGQRVSRQAQAVHPERVTAPQLAAAD